MKRALTIGLVLPLLLVSASPAFAVEQRGKHLGEAAQLEYNIVYTDFPGTMTIDERGATYYFPRRSLTWHTGGSYDEEYFGAYAVYFIGQYINFEIHLRNAGNRTYKNLRVVTTQEYHLASGASYGELLPGSPAQEWFVSELRGGEEIVLKGKAYAALGTRPGLDQTHLQVFHWVNRGRVPLDVQLRDKPTQGRLFVDDQEAGVYCPPAFGLLDF